MKKSFMFSLLASIIFSSAVIAGGVWLYSEQIARSLIQFNIDSTSKQIAIIIRQYDKLFNSFQTELNREARKAILEIADEIGSDYLSRSPESLKKIAIKYGCDEIYFIDKHGKIANTSFPPDQKLDLFSAGIYFENYIRSIFGKGIVFTPQAAVSMRTGTINKYVYYSPVNADFILEISYNLRHYLARHYPESHYEFLSLQKINELTIGNQPLINIDVVTAAEKGRVWSIITPGREINLPKRIIQQTLKEGQMTIANGNILTRYIDAYPISDRFNIFNDELNTTPRLLILTYDLSFTEQYRQHLLMFLLAAVVISITASFLIVSEYLNRRFLRRVMTINTRLTEITRGDYNQRIEISGNDELNQIAGNINKMMTEICAREEQLRNSETRFRSIFEYAPMGIAIIGLDRCIRYYNPAIARMMHCSADELEGNDIIMIIAKEDVSKAVHDFTAVVKGEIPSYIAERRILRSDGKIILAQVTVAAMRDQNDLPSAVIAMLTDITEKRQIERQLFQSQKLEAIGKLAGGVAHDFNNLLQVIMGYGRMLEKYLPDTKAHDIWENIIQAGEKSRNLVRQLLSFGGSGSTDEKIKLEVAPLLNDFIKIIGQVFGEKITIILQTDQPIPPIVANQGQIEQVLMNLCVNARDAMNSNGTLTIAVTKCYLNEEMAVRHPGTTPGFFAGFSISDTGIGMNEEVRTHLFEPFFTTKADPRGAGIGLATVYSIVKKHGGFIEIESNPGQGATFSVLFPVAAEGTPGGDTATQAVATETHRGNGELILICEDEQQVRTLAQMILEEAGYRVLAAADGEEGIQIYDQRKEAISLVILDVIMPKKSGRQVFRYIRSLDTELPIIFTTGYSQEMLGQEFGHIVVQKPYNEESLLAKVREMLVAARNNYQNKA